jgi:hypothetical protein
VKKENKETESRALLGDSAVVCEGETGEGVLPVTKRAANGGHASDGQLILFAFGRQGSLAPP